ncbi:GxGYxY motif-containing protein [Thermosporothrix hazakensis]|jgi:hypothetical protein|uniref:GxGYxY motif-containing protein n=1 Tax=Thermosporothrix hazakensis TaxID=644383 RepID=A0A326U5X1_THEHA|nr:GxGYxYP domain-containing protein [Thermosporothrix hazakensis]PZW27950.1 GxGYxY motif-containing protein [Thermosporothrix hazakensis]GCE51174.1 hypothetical protein KTH_60430 [Thermosporothrix hazakensis]
MTQTTWKRPGVISLLIASLLTLCTLVSFLEPQSASAATAKPQGISWPEGQALPRFAQATHLDAIDMGKQSYEMDLTLSTLEGNVNRTKPRLYLLEDNSDEGKYTWLKHSGIPYTLYNDAWYLIKKYKSEIKGIIIYDPTVPDTINAATTLAGIKTGIVVHPDMVAKLTTSPYTLPILEDLRGKFKTKLDVINWQIANLWPQASHRMLVGLSPTLGVGVPEDNWKDFQVVAQETREIMDSSNRKVYDIDLSNFLGNEAVYVRLQDSFPQGGWGPAVHQVTVKADGQVIAQFTPCSDEEAQYVFDHDSSSCLYDPNNQHRFADATSYFVYRFAPPAGTKQLVVSFDMWNEFKVSATGIKPQQTSDVGRPYGALRDYAVANRAMVFWLSTVNPTQSRLFEQLASQVQPETPYLGWFDIEPAGVHMLSKHGVYVVAADVFTNLTVHSGTRRSMQPPAVPATPKLENKIYVSYVMSDGDNLQYNERYMYKLWNNPDRGKVPISWTISPLLRDASPLILDYYQRTATANDVLISGPSGMGYFYPTEWPQDELPTYFEHTKQYLRQTGLTTIAVLDSGNVNTRVAQAYKKNMGVNGAFYMYDTKSTTSVVEGLPVSVQIHDLTRDRILADIQQAAANWDGTSPLFISVQLIAWETTPSDVVYLTQQLGSKFVPVRGDHFFQLVRQANGLPK